MRYLKTNEALFNGKSLKTFDELIQNFEEKLTEDGLEFEKKKNNLFLGRSAKDILKRVDYLVIEKDDKKDKKSHFEYQFAIALIKESKFGDPFVHVICDCGLSLDDLIAQDDKGRMEIIHGELTESPISIIALMGPCKKQVLSKNKRRNQSKNFYESFPIEDVKDRIYDVTDEFGIEFEIKKAGHNERNGYSVSFEVPVKLEKVSDYVIKADMDIFVKLLTELNKLYKVFDSMGLSLEFNPFSIIHSGNVYLNIVEKVKKDDDGAKMRSLIGGAPPVASIK